MARPRSEEARQKVLSSALQVVTEVGVGGFTIDAVSRSSGVAKSTIYRNWDTGNELLLDAIGCTIEPVPTPNTGSLRQDLIALYSLLLPLLDDPAMLPMMFGLLAKSAADEDFRKLKNDFMIERHNPIMTCLELAVGRGELGADLELDVALDLIEGPFASRRIMRGESIAPEMIETYVDAVLFGLMGIAAPAPKGSNE